MRTRCSSVIQRLLLTGRERGERLLGVLGPSPSPSSSTSSDALFSCVQFSNPKPWRKGKASTVEQTKRIHLIIKGEGFTCSHPPLHPLSAPFLHLSLCSIATSPFPSLWILGFLFPCSEPSRSFEEGILPCKPILRIPIYFNRGILYICFLSPDLSRSASSPCLSANMIAFRCTSQTGSVDI